MSKLKDLKLKQVSEMVKNGTRLPIEKIGQRLRDIREVLGMTQVQLAKIIGTSQAQISRVEENVEACSLKTIKRIASALDCNFLGVVVSRNSLSEKIRKQAELKAKNMMKRLSANMALEKQAIDKKAYDYQLKELIDEYVANPGPELWEK